MQAMVRSVVNDDCTIGDYTILNTNCSIDHGCSIGNGIHIMGGAVVAGLVTLGDFSVIGNNATILPRIKFGVNVHVGAGAVVTKDVSDNTVVTGVPASATRKLVSLEVG